MATIKANQVRKGQILILEGGLFLVTDFEHIAPGNWRAINQIKCKNVMSGQTKQMRMSSDETLETAYLDRRPCTYSFEDGESLVFMDSENFEQHYLQREFVGDAMKFIRDNQQIQITFHEDTPVSVELPTSVVLEVAEAEVSARGDTVSNDKKKAVTTTGLEIKVPPFVNAGEFIKVNTETGEFLGRAKADEV
jgi:elongation factor P